MELKDILSRVDHTLLSQSATWAEIKAICDDGVKYGCAFQRHFWSLCLCQCELQPFSFGRRSHFR